MKSFIVEGSVLIGVGIIGVLSSPEFATLLAEQFGPIWGGTLGVLFINGLVKHLLNLKAIKEHTEQLGNNGREDEPLVLV